MDFMNLVSMLLALCLSSKVTFATPTLPGLSSTYAPIPTAAAGPPVPSNVGYRIQDFGDGAYMVTDGTYQSLFLVSCESVIVVDSPPSIGYNMLRAIQDITDKPVSHVVYSHSHADHIGGAYVLGSPANVTFVAHEATAEFLAATPDKHRPAPTVTFETSYTLQVCNQTLELNYMGDNHEPGNIFIWAPVQRVLMLVDIVYPGWVPYYQLGVANFVPGYVKAHEQILAYDLKHYVGGHLDRSGTREDVLQSQAYVTDLFDAVVQAMQFAADPNSTLYAPDLFAKFEKVAPGNSWFATKSTYALLTEHANNVTNEKWLGKLAGVDVYGIDNANVMFEAVLIDWGINGPFGVTNKAPGML